MDQLNCNTEKIIDYTLYETTNTMTCINESCAAYPRCKWHSINLSDKCWQKVIKQTHGFS